MLAKPLLKLHCVKEQYCEYPVAIKVAMDDGTVQTYELRNRTEYQFNHVMNCLKTMKVGYQYSGKHEKNRGRK